MKNLFLVLVLVLTLFTSACNRHKQIIKTGNKSSVDSLVKLDIIKIDNIADLTQTETTIETSTVKTDFTQENIKIVDYSEPDSTGTTSIIRETFIIRNNNIVTDNNTKSTIKDSSISSSENIFIDKTETDFHKKVKSKTVTKDKTKDNSIKWLWIIIITGVLIMLFLRWKKIFPFD
ncbi:MAG: hypothetical protein JXR36_01195 [Bacteroidales bacterium]|nr:hypothetical protein [Bacteroidales bacterium]